MSREVKHAEGCLVMSGCVRGYGGPEASPETATHVHPAGQAVPTPSAWSGSHSAAPRRSRFLFHTKAGPTHPLPASSEGDPDLAVSLDILSEN